MAKTTLRQEIMKFYNIRRFDGGLNDQFSNEMVADNQATRILNFDLTTRGSLKTRNGCTKMNTSAMAVSASPVRGLFRHYRASGTGTWFAACSGKIYRNAALSSSLSGTFTVNADFDFLAYKDYLLAWNGVDAPIKHLPSGGLSAISAWIPAGAAQSIDDAIVWQDRIWIVPTNSAYIVRHTSAVGGLDGFAAADYLAVGRKDGGSIKKQAILDGNLVLMKDTGIYVLAGTHPDNYQLDRISRNGCISKGSVAVGDNGIIYLSHDGVRYFDGGQSHLLSETDEYFVDIVGAMNAARKSKTTGAYFDRKYLLAYDDVSTTTSINNYVYVYNFMTNSWTKYDIKANVFAQVTGANESKGLYFGHSVSGYVYQLFSGTTDDGTAIPASYKTKAYDMSGRYKDLAMTDKQFRKVFAAGQLSNGVMNMRVSVDSGNQYTGSYNIASEATSGFLLGTSVLGTDYLGSGLSRFSDEKDLPVVAAGKTITIELSAYGASQAAEIDLLGVGFTEKWVRG